MSFLSLTLETSSSEFDQVSFQTMKTFDEAIKNHLWNIVLVLGSNNFFSSPMLCCQAYTRTLPEILPLSFTGLNQWCGRKIWNILPKAYCCPTLRDEAWVTTLTLHVTNSSAKTNYCNRRSLKMSFSLLSFTVPSCTSGSRSVNMTNFHPDNKSLNCLVSYLIDSRTFSKVGQRFSAAWNALDAYSIYTSRPFVSFSSTVPRVLSYASVVSLNILSNLEKPK